MNRLISMFIVLALMFSLSVSVIVAQESSSDPLKTMTKQYVESVEQGAAGNENNTEDVDNDKDVELDNGVGITLSGAFCGHGC